MSAAFVVWLFLLTAFSVVVGCRANYTFFQTYHSYLNPLSNRGDTGQCCDNQRMPPCSTLCDNIFTICVLQSGEELPSSDSDIQPEQCPLGFLRSQTISNRDNITFNTSAPVIFTGDVWPGSFVLVVQVFDDDDGNPDDFVDLLVVEQSLTPSPTPTSPTTYTSSAGIFFLELSFRVECSENVFGDACDVFCVPRNDSVQGYFACNSEGERVCLPGYQNVDSNCTECTPAENCSTIGGFCNEPGECLCFEGYEGSLCNILSRKPQSSITLLHDMSGDQPSDGRVTAVVAGVVVGVVVLVITGVSIIVVVLVLRKKDIIFRKSNDLQTSNENGQSTGKLKSIIPGDNPIYMSSADLNEVQRSPSSQPHSPTHSTAVETTSTEELVSTVGETEGTFDDTVYSTSHSTTPGSLDPYGNYGDKTITRVASLATPPPLFDDSKYAEWTPPPSSDSDDVDTDCQSEDL